MTRLVNLTQHTVVVLDPAGMVVATVPPSGAFARIPEIVTEDDPLIADDGALLPCIRVSYASAVIDLPEPKRDVAYVVSRLTAAQANRDDVYFPAGEVRNADGVIVGCRSLGRFSPNSGGTDHAGGS